MARRRTTKPDTSPAIPTNSLVASSVRYKGTQARIYRPSENWQREAYRHYGICGEARYAAQFFANSLSRSTLYSTSPDSAGVYQRDVSGPGPENLARVFGPETSAQTLSAIGLHLTIAGECYLVGREHKVPDFDADPDYKGEVWEVVSTLEMEVSGERWAINYHNGAAAVPLTDNDVVIRIWRPHPERRIEADSPFRSLLPTLEEIEKATRHIFAQLESRLAGAGILFMPQGMTFPQPVDQDGATIATANEADAFMTTLADTMMSAKVGDGGPEDLVPIVVTAPDESIDKARLMHFWSELDSAVVDIRSGAIGRFADGMDMPREQVLGMSSNSGTGGGNSNGVSHWGAWQIDESTIKLHIEPMLESICTAVTVSFLRAATDGMEIIRFDTKNLRLRPDRSKEALELYDRGLIKAEVVVRENRFEPEDMMDDEERKQWLLIKVASGSATPDMVLGALKALGVNIVVEQPPEPTEVPNEARPVPSLEDHPEKKEPDFPASQQVLLHASEALVLRGLERAGNRLRRACKGATPVAASYETHVYVPVKDPDYLLEDAWTCADIVLDGIASPEEIVPTLDAYCRMLFSLQQSHTRERLSRWLQGTEVAA